MADSYTESAPQPNRRRSQRDIDASAIKTRNLPNDLMSTTTLSSNGPFTVNNGATLNITSKVSGKNNSSIVVGAVPYMICFFQDSLDATKIIPGGSAIVSGNYIITGPLAIPTFGGTNGSNGNDVVFRTALYNNSGSSQVIYYLTNTKILTGGAAGAV